MKYISLFSGIGGFDLAFKRAGMECVAVCEIDRAAQGILQRHSPEAQLIDDVRKVGGTTHERGSIDLICGGFPCQDLSVAGKRAGLAGERSGLWFEFARIIDELEPRWVVIENVPGLLSSCGCPTCGAVRRLLRIHTYLRRKRKIHQSCAICHAAGKLLASHRGRDFAKILQWLAERGYGVVWRVLDAQFFGVPQRRRRVFIVGSLGSGRSAEVLFESEGLSGDIETGREAGKEVAYSLRSNPSHSGDKGDGGINTTMVAGTLKGRTGQRGYPDPSDGNGGGLVVAMHETGQGFWQEDDIAGTLRAEGENRPSRPSNIVAFGGNNTSGEIDVSTALNAHGGPCRHDFESETFIVEQNNKVSTPDMISLRSNPAQPVIFQQNTRDEVRLLGGDGQIVGALAAQAGMKQQNYIAFSSKDNGRDAGDLSPTLRSMEYDKSHINGGGQVAVASSFGVRRLTPTECERLQGFPDGWTDGQSDSARYRQLGNAVAVPVVEWIGKRIVEYDQDPHL